MKKNGVVSISLSLTVLVGFMLAGMDPHLGGRATDVVTLADRHHLLVGTTTADPTDAPFGTPGQPLDCLSCHAVDNSSGSTEIIVERDCLACHGVNGAISDRHHLLYGAEVPDSTDPPYSVASDVYVCLSCHEIDDSMGRNHFLVERDCRVCHGPDDVNQIPVADPNGPYTGRLGDSVRFDGSGSFDPDGAIVSYMWDFGDGGTGIGATPSHSYGTPGTYTVKLVVTDNHGATAEAETTARIADVGPGVTFWIVKVPLLQIDFELKLEPFESFLLVVEFLPDGTVVHGIGIEFDGIVFWLDAAGSLFYGTIDHDAGTMMGIVFNLREADSIWFAEKDAPGSAPVNLSRAGKTR